LRVHAHRDQEIHLDGRGLLLVPSYFLIHHPVTLFDDSLPPVLVYPIERMPETLPLPAPQRALGALIGSTRAAILEAATGVTTTDLGRLVGVAAATASEHAAVLREAGLIESHRDGSRMVHQLTRLGKALLNGG
jgi:DNA-binding transcriptional ArsR family regulator